jgi:hypothetical protein
MSFALAIIAGIGLFCVLMPLFNSIFPAVVLDSFGKEQQVMPVSNMLWSLVLCVAAGVFLLTFVFKKLKKIYGK